MATKENLMGLGVVHHQANRLGRTPIFVTAAGTTLADARVLGGTEYDVIVNSGTGGVVLRSPASAESNVLLGDIFYISNYTAASVALYTRNATIITSGVSVSGSVGFSVQAGQTIGMQPITATTWRVLSILGISVTAA